MEELSKNVLYAAHKENGDGQRWALLQRRGVRLMAMRGWYVYSELPWSVGYRYGALRKSEVELTKLDEWLETDTLRHSGAILEKAIQLFPTRAHILKAARRHVLLTDYVSAVPLLLSQSDGIIKELTTANMFHDRKHFKKKQYIDKLKKAERAQRWWLSTLLDTLAIDGGFHGGKTELSRHRILHGEALQYGTTAIVARSLSLVGYVSLLSEWTNPERRAHKAWQLVAPRFQIKTSAE